MFKRMQIHLHLLYLYNKTLISRIIGDGSMLLSVFLFNNRLKSRLKTGYKYGIDSWKVILKCYNEIAKNRKMSENCGRTYD